MKLHISPCPNDTFIFHALLHGLVDCEGLDFDVEFEDIDRLNHRACNEDIDVIKISYATLPLVRERYMLLRSGGAMGFGNAPIVVGKNEIRESVEIASQMLQNLDEGGVSQTIDLHNCTIAIPGEQTTAALLLKKLINPDPNRLKVYLFSDIADAIVRGEVDAGVLIHEGRFTYPEKGLRLIADLGELWDARYGLPVPLGAILVRKSLGEDMARKIERVIRRSVEYAMENPAASEHFVKCHAAELDPQVRQKHISYFVNRFSLDFGTEGERAITTLIGEQ